VTIFANIIYYISTLTTFIHNALSIWQHFKTFFAKNTIKIRRS